MHQVMDRIIGCCEQGNHHNPFEGHDDPGVKGMDCRYKSIEKMHHVIRDPRIDEDRENPQKRDQDIVICLDGALRTKIHAVHAAFAG